MRRTWGLALAGLALVAGCSGEAKVEAKASAAPPIDIVRAAGTKTADAGTARMSMVMATTAGGETFNMTGEGLFDLATQRGSMTMTLGQFGTAEMIMLDDVLYMKMPALNQLTGGKPWLKLELDALLKASGTNVEQLRQLANQDPTQSLAYLEGISGDVTVVGQEPVRGTATTHYKATIDLDEVAKKHAAMASMITTLKTQIGSARLPVEVWVDGDGRMRKMTQKFTVTVEGTKAETSVSMEMYDFGTPVSVSAPPAAETQDGAPLLGVK
jgi:hypothetical protein